MHPTLVHRHHTYDPHRSPTPTHPQTDLKRMELSKTKIGMHMCGFIKYHDCDDKEHILLISSIYYFSQRFNILLMSLSRVQCLLKFSSTLIFSKQNIVNHNG